MATSLLRLGRLGAVKCLLREGWSTPKAPFVAALCTKGDVPPKTPKKAKASTIEADERASLLAYKPAVAFPSKLSAAGFLLKDVALDKSETAEAVSTDETTTDSPVAATAAADISVEEAKITVPPTDEATTEIGESKTSDVKAEGQKDQEDTSSSSSSDSDSDSDSDDEKPKTETPVHSGEKAAEEEKAPGLTTEEVGVPDKSNPETTAFRKAQESAETVTKATPEEVPAPSAKPVGSVETLIDPAPVISSTSEAVHEVPSESITVATSDNLLDSAAEIKMAPTEEIAVEKEPEIKVEKEPGIKVEKEPGIKVEKEPEIKVEKEPEIKVEKEPEIKVEKEPEIKVEKEPEIKVEEAVKVSAEVLPEVTTEARSEDVADTTVDAGPEGSSGAPGDVPAPKAEAGTLSAEGTPSEELVDPAPVAADAVEPLTETDVVETPEEQAAAKVPEPEPFDNTTYKNLQHHEYDMYTFADLDVEMSKHRLPQPSAHRH
ncbi:proteoglycan 4 isoform X2 [Pimephales promelas]|uniref:proteoglycan 4 isoform X2 n=1 Tax=Pimephales promelas TaxID=90988 RepID=UPI001955F149|nr:proteoglycan 4 isoform X2 [Pimephales promelas]KAG1945434.1 NADH dehydrogenase [ubiquinone] flavoprotein 3, mitochondrial [Pimephales promelas]